MSTTTRGTRVGFVTEGEPSSEQRAALDWLAGRSEFAGKHLRVLDVATGEIDVERFDALWWHRARRIDGLDASTTAKFADRIDRFRRSGGGVLLSSLAFTAVDDLGIDELGPDRTFTDVETRSAGFLAKSIYREHPLFDGIRSLRFETEAPGGRTTGARYEERLPVAGEIFAGNYVDGTDVPHEMPVALWQDEPGVVVGIGEHLHFGRAGERCESVRSRLAANALSVATNGPSCEHPPSAHLETVEEFRRTRERVDRDPNRPAYHFSPPANWLNDPNGLTYRDGKYHLFYNHNPAGPFHGTIHAIPNYKGHAVSDDLVHWEDRPIGLSPTPESPDDYGTWTGCVVDDDGTPTFVYTGATDGDRYETAGRQRPCLATGSADLETWTKYPGNPVIADPPADLDLVSNDWEEEFRDHCVWREEGTWYQVIGTGVEGEGGAALLYRSSTLSEWEYVGPVLVGDRERTGSIWECPELFDLGGKHLLHVSSNSTVYSFLGEFDGREFTPERRDRLDYGDFYAPQSFVDERGRRVLFGWITEQQRRRGTWAAGWGGMVSVPRVLSLGEDGDLRITPHPEIERLRDVHRSVYDRVVAPTGDESHAGGGLFQAGDALELEAAIDPGDATEVGLVLRQSPDGVERTRIGYRPADGVVAVDRSESTLREDVRTTTQEVPAQTVDGSVSLRVFLDRSAIELFVNERRCLTSRIYPTRRDSAGVGAYAIGGEGIVEHLECWTMDAIWESA